MSLVVPDGTLVGLLGPNGAGKSTLLRAIAGLVPVERGEVLLRGESVGRLPPHERTHRGICLIPEGRGIFPTLTVADNLRVSLDGRAALAEEHFPVLRERRRQLAGTLSGGEQQMLALARAVSTDPLLLMADELSLGLAPKVLRTLFETVGSLKAKGRTILLVEQYATHVLALADLVYVLNRGRLVWAGEPAELRASPVLSESYLGTR